MPEPFHGTYTVLVTPFTADGARVDLAALERLVAFQLPALGAAAALGRRPALRQRHQSGVPPGWEWTWAHPACLCRTKTSQP